MNAGKVDLRAVLRFAGADKDAAEGSLPWALAQVDADVAELIAALRQSDEWIKQAVIDGSSQPSAATLTRNRDVLARIGGGA